MKNFPVSRIKFSTCFIICLCLFCSCRIYHGQKIVSPELGASLNALYPEVDSFQPTLCWKEGKSKNNQPCTYTVTVYKTNVSDKVFKKVKSRTVDGKTLHYYRGIKGGESWGTMVYTRGSLSSECHLIEIPLESNSYYTWTVEMHRGDKIYRHSHINFHRFYGLASSTISNVPYGFVTPEKPLMSDMQK